MRAAGISSSPDMKVAQYSLTAMKRSTVRTCCRIRAIACSR